MFERGLFSLGGGGGVESPPLLLRPVPGRRAVRADPAPGPAPAHAHYLEISPLVGASPLTPLTGHRKSEPRAQQTCAVCQFNIREQTACISVNSHYAESYCVSFSINPAHYPA